VFEAIFFISNVIVPFGSHRMREPGSRERFIGFGICVLWRRSIGTKARSTNGF
jgi:hypothetical protein